MKLSKYSEFKKINEDRVVKFNNPKQGNFVVIAGGPGSGKSFASSNLIDLKDFKYVNVDTHRELLAKKMGLDLGDPEDNMKILDMTHTTSDPRNKTVQHLKQFLKNISGKDNLPNILFDAGGGQTKVMTEIHQLAKEAGYETTLVWVKTDLSVALDRNKQRERTLKDEMVVNYHNKVRKSMGELQPLFDNYWEIDNSEFWDATNRPTDRIKKLDQLSNPDK